MTITETRNGSEIQLEVAGRVDTVSSPQLQQSILQAFQKGSDVILNMEQVEYISSAGLRALLIGQKTANSKTGTLTLIHVGEFVMEVFKMTGFADMLTIR